MLNRYSLLYDRKYSILSNDGRFAVDINKMDKNYRPLWKFAYRKANEEPRIIINMHHDGNFDVCWYPDGEKDMDVNPEYIREEGKRKQKRFLTHMDSEKHKSTIV